MKQGMMMSAQASNTTPKATLPEPANPATPDTPIKSADKSKMSATSGKTANNIPVNDSPTITHIDYPNVFSANDTNLEAIKKLIPQTHKDDVSHEVFVPPASQKYFNRELSLL